MQPGPPTPPPGPDQPFGAPPPGPPPPYPAVPPPGQSPQNTIGLLGMIFGIVGLVLALCCAYAGAATGITGVVLGILGMRKVTEGTATNRGMALAGIICGAIATVLAVINIILGVWLRSRGYLDV